ncbi:hypothetical protein ACU5AX_04080 [Sphingomonas sp. XXL09]|uniref:hypothetical protein n=1 Tax=Sphingomonas sp. XXL09 TaxID=3457787 RepID=UPI00406BB7AF
METSAQQHRQAFSHWLRTGRLPVWRSSDGTERKFNPYHDPRDGRFTSGPGGAASPRDMGGLDQLARLKEQFRRQEALGVSPGEEESRAGRGGNSRAFQDPMTLEQVFPGLSGAPGGSIVAAADHGFGFTEGSVALQDALYDGMTRKTLEDIRKIEPHYRDDTLDPMPSLASKMARLDRLRDHLSNLKLVRARDLAAKTGNFQPLQVETIDRIQRKVNIAYEHGLAHQRHGTLKSTASSQVDLGNYVDRETRGQMRQVFRQLGIKSALPGNVKINRYAPNSRDGTRTVPDYMVGNIMTDISTRRKTARDSQVQRFFMSDSKPHYVAIIRPTQLGGSYISTRPEGLR